MTAICLYFQVHQPYRVGPFDVFDVGEGTDYFSYNKEGNLNNREVLRKVARKSYLPANAILRDLLIKNPSFTFSFSFSGTLLAQLEEYAPEVLVSFQDLVSTGRVEVLGETSHHTLSFFYSRKEFERQVREHEILVERLFGVRPKVFRNTELAYTNELGVWAEQAGYGAVLAEGWDYVLGWRSPNYLYRPTGAEYIKLLLKNYRFSDDIAFRFSEKTWSGWPLSAEKFAHWISATNGSADVLNLFMDYETFGEHQWKESGIFDFLSALPREIMRHPDNTFMSVSNAARAFPSRGDIDVPHIMTWADTERDLTAWTGNEMQRNALHHLYKLENDVISSGDEKNVEVWRRLQTSDHFYYMCTKWSNDGDVHAYFNPYSSPHQAYTTFMNVLIDFRLRLQG